ncbi:FHA domain-containing protein [bacterium]|nr:FHA domain-containing protein [bacterium]
MDNSLISVQLIKNSSIEQHISFSENPNSSLEIAYRGVLRVGKMSSSHIKIEDSQMPRIHSTIESIDGVFYITPMGDTNSLYNNSAFISKVEIKEWDELTIGEWKIRFFPLKTISDILKIVENSNNYNLKYLDKTNNNTVLDGEKIDLQELESFDFIDDENGSKTESISLISEQDSKTPSKKYEQSILTIDEPKAIGKGIEIKQYWQNSIMAVNLYKTPQKVTIGEEQNDDFFVSSIDLPNKNSFTILEPDGEQFSVNFLLNRVDYNELSECYSLDELLKSDKATIKNSEFGNIKLIYKTKIAFEIGEYRFEISSVPIFESTSKFSFLGLLDSFNLKFNIVSTLVHLALLALLFLMPPDIESFSIEQLDEIPERYATIILDKKPEDKKIKQIEFDQKEMKTAKTEFDTKLKPRDVKFDNTNINVSNLSKKQREDKIATQNSGIFVASKKFKGLVGGGGGIQDDNLRLTENSDIISDSNVNITIRGTGSGNSGGSGIGPGGIFTKRDPNDNYRGISFNPNSTTRKKRDIVVGRSGPDRIVGSLTESQIKSVVNKNISQIRYCYEHELMRKPELSGSITVKWKINPQGEVILVNIEGGTLKDSAVQKCIINKIKKWSFPEPVGGGSAIVIFPFNFRSN